MNGSALPAIPHATYRLQFTPQFGFRDAEAIVPYLHDLGIGAMYASPYLKARPGSMHGYDIVDHNQLNPEVGTAAEHASMIATAQQHGLGHVLDFVPNHMGIGPQNPWWRDVLEWGELSPYATFFDINWRPLKPELQGKVLVPTLGDHYGRVLESGELALAFDAASGTFVITYYDNVFPVAPKSYGEILGRAAQLGAPELRSFADNFLAARARPSDPKRRRSLLARTGALKRALARLAESPHVGAAIAAAVAAYAIDPDQPHSADALDTLIGAQNYRLAFWRVAVDEINYRRFFDINDLAGLRVEDAEVLGQTHRLIFRLIEQGMLQGLRIDHVDGLYNPGGYCNLLHERMVALDHELYIVVEKILGPGERLHTDWLIDGTTGYEYMNLVNGLFVDQRAESAFDRIYARFTGTQSRYETIAYEAKRRIMSINLASELAVLATELSRIAGADRHSSDFTYNGLRDALLEVVAAFPVYRTYVVSEDVSDEDRAVIEGACALAAQRSQINDASLFTFIADVLTLRVARPEHNYDRNAVLRFAMRFQQYTSPVMAKSIEDTAFYRYVRLISLNEVGGEPTHFGVSVDEFHTANAERAATRPHSMLATATHDHKRGEDTRIRIDTLTEFAGAWGRALRRWARLNRTKLADVRGFPAPSPFDEYHLYQELIGTWPPEWTDPGVPDDDAYAAYIERICAYMLKATREAKMRTSWQQPNEGYEAATDAFIRGILERGDDARFPAELAAFVAMIQPAAMVSSIAQVVLKCTSPGIPDVYQGCELWDHSLVDPDNRRPVDFAARAAMLAASMADPAGARGSWVDGRVKLFVLAKLMRLRADARATFIEGDYVPLEISGAGADRAVAFQRAGTVVVVPRLAASIVEPSADGPRVVFRDERVLLANPAAGYRELFTGRTIVPDADGSLAMSDLLGPFPVAVLTPE